MKGEEEKLKMGFNALGVCYNIRLLHKRTMWRSFFPLSNIYFALNQFLKAGMQIRWGLSGALITAEL